MMSVSIPARQPAMTWVIAAEACKRHLSRLSFVDSLLPASIVIAILLRFFSLSNIPPALNQDEAVNGYDAYSLFLTGRDHHGHPFPFAGLESFGDWASPVLTFLTVPAVGLFGLRVDVVRGVSATVGVLAVPAVYFLAIELFRRRSLAIVAAWLLAISPWHVHRSRFANPAAIAPTMLVLTMVALLWAIHRRSPRGLVIAALMAVLSIASYPTMKLYIPLLLVAAAFVYRRSIFCIKRAALFYAAVIFLFITGPIYYLSLVDPAGRARLDQVSIFHHGPVTVSFLIHQYISYFSPRVFFITGNGHPAQTPTPSGVGVEPLATLPLYLLGFLSVTAKALRPSRASDRPSALFLLSALALYPIPASLTVPAPHLGRAAHLIPLLALFGAAGALAIGDGLKSLLHKIPTVASRAVLGFGIIITIVLGWELVGRYRDYFYEYAKRESVVEYFQYGLPQALGYARLHEQDYDEIWVANENQAYIYVLFFNKWPPSDVHRNLKVRREPPKFNEVEAIGKYHFGDPPAIDAEHVVLLYMVRDSAGRQAYEVRAAGTTNGKRMLLVIKTPTLASQQAS